MLNNFSSELKKEFLTVLFFLISTLSFAQTSSEYAKISALADRSSYKPGDTVKLAIVADIIKPYHINSYKVTDANMIPIKIRGITKGITVMGVYYLEDKKLKFEIITDKKQY